MKTEPFATRLPSDLTAHLDAVCKKLVGENGYRIRTGDYRILYAVDSRSRIVSIYRIGNSRLLRC